MSIIMHEIDDEAAAGWSEHFEKNLEGKERIFALANALPVEKRVAAQRKMVLGTLEHMIPAEKYSVHRFDARPERRDVPVVMETAEQASDRALRQTQAQLGGIAEATWIRNALLHKKDPEAFKQEIWQTTYEKNLANG